MVPSKRGLSFLFKPQSLRLLFVGKCVGESDRRKCDTCCIKKGHVAPVLQLFGAVTKRANKQQALRPFGIKFMAVQSYVVSS